MIEVGDIITVGLDSRLARVIEVQTKSYKVWFVSSGVVGEYYFQDSQPNLIKKKDKTVETKEEMWYGSRTSEIRKIEEIIWQNETHAIMKLEGVEIPQPGHKDKIISKKLNVYMVRKLCQNIPYFISSYQEMEKEDIIVDTNYPPVVCQCIEKLNRSAPTTYPLFEGEVYCPK